MHVCIPKMTALMQYFRHKVVAWHCTDPKQQKLMSNACMMPQLCSLLFPYGFAGILRDLTM